MKDVSASHTAGSVTSRDGTTVGYLQVGRDGPGLVLLHGGMETAEHHLQLAEQLAGDFTVYLPDRRGRGMSGPYGEGYCLRKEVEDVKALLDETGAEVAFGVSSGAIICLQAGLELPELRKMAIYEPPLSINGSFPVDWLTPFDKKIAEGDRLEALVIATKATRQFGHTLPRWLIRTMARIMLGDMVRLVPTFHYDARLVVETLDQWRRYEDVKADVLLMGGGRSPAYMKTALDALEQVLPHVERVEFPKLNQGGSGNRNRGGNPALVAGTMREFFARPGAQGR
ncbi:alpha/beta fold hydrolase [Sphaerisporangium fuscum]|uniref:alpha/beta fold hydrolase n=1 Tax=Sphaerisporangium fuscum TaxID=2835868 RepID=UPI001BDD4808|nr:alpha/beta hydrolase [Sphaerisporangium fuscum]